MGKYMWPGDRLEGKHMRMLHRLSEESGKPINDIIADLVEKEYGERFPEHYCPKACPHFIQYLEGGIKTFEEKLSEDQLKELRVAISTRNLRVVAAAMTLIDNMYISSRRENEPDI